MTKHTHNAVVKTSDIHGDEISPDRVDVPLTARESKRSSENVAQAPLNRPTVGGKRKVAVADDGETVGQKSAVRDRTKTESVLKKLRSAKGTSVPELCEATGLQAHSVRGFLSAVVRKKLGLMLVSQVGKDGARRYRVEGRAD